MKVVAFYTTYNEIRLLPWQHQWCKSQGVEMYVIDNMSTDGTKQYLEKYNIPHHSIDTDGAFDLRPLLSEITTAIHKVKPDWLIYSGMDMFFVDKDSTIKELCKRIRIHDPIAKVNFVSCNQYTFLHTSKKNATTPTTGNPFQNNFHYQFNGKHTFIAKYHPEITITPDRINSPLADEYLIISDTVIFETHAAKTINDRIQLLKRRQKAWDNGMNRNWGWHYRQQAEQGFIFPEDQQTDIRTQPHLFELYKKLQEITPSHSPLPGGSGGPQNTKHLTQNPGP